jgi:hypothetical protein
MMTLSRRDIGRVFAGALLGRLRGAGREPLTWAAQADAGAGTGTEWRYRADAQVIVLGISLLHRQGVGEGSASWREWTKDGAAMKLLEFSGRSAPERAAGLNRFGFIQELSRTVEGEGTESLYFGLMTSSPEDNAADAKKALHSTSKDAMYSAIDGHLTAGAIETTGAKFVAPARTTAADRSETMERARQALAGAQKRTAEWHSAEGAPLPFLHALAEALSRKGAGETQCAYNGRMYRLKVQKAPDGKTPGVTRVSATLQREGGALNEFRVWVEEGSARPLPLRVEYQPKSYLRLTFEAIR